jgi:hypothetical protein
LWVATQIDLPAHSLGHSKHLMHQLFSSNI